MQNPALLLENSFLKPLLDDETITDITFNGEKLFFVSNEYGRSFYRNISYSVVMNLLRQIANVTNQVFSYQNPVLDVSFANYRLSAMHEAIRRFGYQNVCSFALRIAPKEPLDLFSLGVVNEKIIDLIKMMLKTNKSIVIAGATGVGKTELQKYIVSLLSSNKRLIVLDNVQELSSLQKIEHLDITHWEIDERKKESDLANLIKTALRFHPDYILIAESRGEEMKEIYKAALTGHPTIVTIHASRIEDVYPRLYQMSQTVFSSLTYKEAKEELKQTFPFVIYLNKKSDETGHIYRYIEKISQFNQKGKLEIVYEKAF